jgi:hypothetical protein
MPRRIDLGRAVLFAGSALLFVSLFVDWFDPDLTAWEVFEALDLVLAGLAIAGMVAAVRPDLLAPWAGAAVPGAAVLIVFVQLVNRPPAAVDADLASGAWLALAGALLMGAGAALSLAAISVTVHVRERDVRRRVAAVDRRRMNEEDLEAEDLDADADADDPAAERRSTSLFGSLGRRDAPDHDLGDDEPAQERAPRFPTRDASAGASADADGGAAVGGGDPERTQPMAGLPDDEGEPGRP